MSDATTEEYLQRLMDDKINHGSDRVIRYMEGPIRGSFVENLIRAIVTHTVTTSVEVTKALAGVFEEQAKSIRDLTRRLEELEPSRSPPGVEVN